MLLFSTEVPLIERGGSGELVERDSRRTHRLTNASEKPIQNRTRLVLKCDESGMGRDESGALGTNRANLGTNQRREVWTTPRPRHAVGAALRDSLGLIGPQRRPYGDRQP